MTSLRRIVATLIRSGVNAAGFDLVRRNTVHVWGHDPFRDQVELLCGRRVETVFDVGANAGQTTAIYRELFPAATIHAFEPFPAMLEQLRNQYTDCPQVCAHQLALADRTERRTLFMNRSHYTNSLLPPTATAGQFVGPGLMEAVGEMEVDAIRLDDFCAQQRIERIDVLKMDIQGGEAIALRGAAGLLRQRLVKLVYLEVNFAPMYVDQGSFCDVAGLLTNYGFRLFGLYNLVHLNQNGIGWADAIFYLGDTMPAAKGTTSD